VNFVHIGVALAKTIKVAIAFGAEHDFKVSRGGNDEYLAA
jgi:hypothetical protein